MVDVLSDDSDLVDTSDSDGEGGIKGRRLYSKEMTRRPRSPPTQAADDAENDAKLKGVKSKFGKYLQNSLLPESHGTRASKTQPGSRRTSATKDVTTAQGLSELRSFLEKESLTTGIEKEDNVGKGNEAFFNDIEKKKEFEKEVQATSGMKFAVRKLDDTVAKLEPYVKDAVHESFQKALQECLSGAWTKIREMREKGRQCALADEHFRKKTAEADEQRRHYVQMQTNYLKEVSQLRDQLNHAREETMKEKGIEVHLWQPLQDLDSATRELVTACVEEHIKSNLTSGKLQEALEEQEAAAQEALEALKQENLEQANVIAKLREQLDSALEEASKLNKSISDSDSKTGMLQDNSRKEVTCGACGAIVVVSQDGSGDLSKENSEALPGATVDNGGDRSKEDSETLRSASPTVSRGKKSFAKEPISPRDPRGGKRLARSSTTHTRSSTSRAASPCRDSCQPSPAPDEYRQATKEPAVQPDTNEEDEEAIFGNTCTKEEAGREVRRASKESTWSRRPSDCSKSKTARAPNYHLAVEDVQQTSPPQNGTGKAKLLMQGLSVNAPGVSATNSPGGSARKSSGVGQLPSVSPVPPASGSATRRVLDVRAPALDLPIKSASMNKQKSLTNARKSSTESTESALETTAFSRQVSCNSNQSFMDFDAISSAKPKAAPKARGGSKIWHFMRGPA